MLQYTEIISLCKLKEFVDTGKCTYEVWTDGELNYICMWFASNESEMPSTIYEHGSNYTKQLI